MIYKKFLIQYNSYQRETKEWYGGHSSERTGEYETVGGYEAIHTSTGKSTGRVFSDESTAKLWVDAYLRGTITRKAFKIRKETKKLNDKRILIEQKKRDMCRQLDGRIRELEKKSQALLQQLPHTLD